jgi:membrane protease YdiL (CAAX protease family)
VLVAPVTEELLFRGLLLPALAAQHGTRNAVIGTAILFGLFHLDYQAAVYATLMGLLLGAVRVRGGSVLPAIALHAGFNALPVLLPEELAPISGFNVPETDHVPAWIVSLALAISVAALAGLWALLPRDQTS